MPPLKEKKRSSLLRLVPYLGRIGKPQNYEDVNRIVDNTEKDKAHDEALIIKEKREKQQKCYEKYAAKYEIPAEFQKFLPLYLDPSDDPKAVENNIKLLESLKNEEGKKKLAQKIASELMNLDLSKMMFFGKTEDAVDYYSAHYHEVELASMAGEASKLSDHLDKSVTDEISDRSEILESASIYKNHAEVAESDVYSVIPDLSVDDTEKLLKELEEEQEREEQRRLQQQFDEQMFFLTVMLTIKKIAAMNIIANAQYMSYSDMINVLWTKRFLYPLRRAANEDHEWIPFIKIPEEIFKGNVVELVTEPEKNIEAIVEDCSVVKADAPISLDVKKLKIADSRFVLASPKALSAQGRGFQEECGKLAAELKKQNLWYVSGDGAYGRLLALLGMTASSSSVPNKEKIDKVINDALKYCNEFEQSMHGKNLEEKSLKRLEAVMNAKIVLSGHKRTRETITYLARKEHESSIGNVSKKIITAEKVGEDVIYDVKYVPSFRASAMNSEAIRSDDEQRVFNYRNKLENLKKQGGAIGRLCAETTDDVGLFQELVAHKSDLSAFRVASSFPELDSTVAKLALIEVIDHERTQRIKKGEDPAVKGPIESKFDELVSHEAEWKKVLASIEKTLIVNKIANDLRNSFLTAVADLTGSGGKQLAHSLLSEMKANKLNKELVSKDSSEGTGGGISEEKQEPVQPQKEAFVLVK